MKNLNGKTRTALTCIAAVALITNAAVFGGFEGALASLGAISLIAVLGAFTYAMKKVRMYSKAFDFACRVDNGESIALPEDAVAKHISNRDKKQIMKHLDEFFEIEQDDEDYAEVEPITEKDKKLLMAHIDDFFTESGEQGDAKPVTEKDKKVIMANIDKFFETDWEEGKQIFA